ncbi:hypothetical protein DFH09DRAFT_1275686 [Mycena vulgaris]|nr:hypothetical protein DFH09DRAFT_1275686 [Mycena vulgaris]
MGSCQHSLSMLFLAVSKGTGVRGRLAQEHARRRASIRKNCAHARDPRTPFPPGRNIVFIYFSPPSRLSHLLDWVQQWVAELWGDLACFKPSVWHLLTDPLRLPRPLLESSRRSRRGVHAPQSLFTRHQSVGMAKFKFRAFIPPAEPLSSTSSALHSSTLRQQPAAPLFSKFRAYVPSSSSSGRPPVLPRVVPPVESTSLHIFCHPYPEAMPAEDGFAFVDLEEAVIFDPSPPAPPAAQSLEKAPEMVLRMFPVDTGTPRPTFYYRETSYVPVGGSYYRTH